MKRQIIVFESRLFKLNRLTLFRLNCARIFHAVGVASLEIRSSHLRRRNFWDTQPLLINSRRRIPSSRRLKPKSGIFIPKRVQPQSLLRDGASNPLRRHHIHLHIGPNRVHVERILSLVRQFILQRNHRALGLHHLLGISFLRAYVEERFPKDLGLLWRFGVIGEK